MSIVICYPTHAGLNVFDSKLQSMHQYSRSKDTWIICNELKAANCERTLSVVLPIYVALNWHASYVKLMCMARAMALS